MNDRSVPPGPGSGMLGLGNLQKLRSGYLDFVVELAREYGDCVYYRVGPERIYQFVHPDQYREVLVAKAKSFSKPTRFKKVFRRWNGNGLLLNEGDSWARQRRLVQPAFHPQRLLTYADIILKHTNLLISECVHREVNIARHLNRLTLLFAAETLFGARVTDVADQFVEELTALQISAFQDFTAPIILPLWWPSPGRRRMRQAIRFLDELVQDFISGWRQSPRDRGDLLSMLLMSVDQNGAAVPMTDRQVRDESINLLLGASETTGTALTWAIYLLAKFPEVQARAYEEVCRATASRPLDGAMAADLVYLEAVFNEAMRLYPPAYATSRQATEEVEIAGYRVPAGAQVQLILYCTHRDERWFEEASSFRPERFLASTENPIDRFAFLPFGAGPRACIGKGLAMLEGVLTLANLLKHCRIELGSGQQDLQLEPQISLHPRGGLRVQLTQR